MKPSLRSSILISALCLAIFGTGFAVGMRNVQPMPITLHVRIPVPPPPAEWYDAAETKPMFYENVSSINDLRKSNPAIWCEGGSIDPQGRGYRAGDRFELASYQTSAPAQAIPAPTPVAPIGPAPAQPSPLPTSPITPTLGVTILALAGLTATFLNGIKSSLPQIGGWGAKFLAVAIATTGTIAVAPAGQPPLVTAGAALTAALAAMGVHDYASGKSSVTPAPVPASK